MQFLLAAGTPDDGQDGQDITHNDRAVIEMSFLKTVRRKLISNVEFHHYWQLISNVEFHHYCPKISTASNFETLKIIISNK